MRQKEVEFRNNRFKLGEIENILEECENQLMEENKSLMLLEVRTDKIAERRIECEEVDSDVEIDLCESNSSAEEERAKVFLHTY